jgi:hypothetical protein
MKPNSMGWPLIYSFSFGLVGQVVGVKNKKNATLIQPSKHFIKLFNSRKLEEIKQFKLV